MDQHVHGLKQKILDVTNGNLKSDCDQSRFAALFLSTSMR